jgi:hypothetical protein
VSGFSLLKMLVAANETETNTFITCTAVRPIWAQRIFQTCENVPLTVTLTLCVKNHCKFPFVSSSPFGSHKDHGAKVRLSCCIIIMTLSFGIFSHKDIYWPTAGRCLMPKCNRTVRK